MEGDRVDSRTDVARYLDPRVPSLQAEQVHRLIAEASRSTSTQPVVINLQLPAEAPRRRRDIDWATVAFLGGAAFLILALMAFVFIGYMSTPPPPSITHNMPNCQSWCW